MATTIRLTRIGKHKRPFYRIVVADSRKPRDGRYIEIIGTFDPLKADSAVTLKQDRAINWLSQGATTSQTVHELFKKAGVYKALDEATGSASSAA